jgi:membrane protease YdiL (CAAX protease family)
MNDTLQMRGNKNPNQALLEIVYLFIVPVVLIYLKVIPYSWRLLVLLGVSLLIMSIIRYQQWTKVQLGLTRIVRFRSVAVWGTLTLAGIVAIVSYAQWFGFEPLALLQWEKSWRLLLFFIPLSILQEVAYRAFLTERLREVGFSMGHRVLLNALLFTLLHIIYPYAAITLPIAFIGGFLFAWLYERYQSLVLACIAHAVLNFTAVLFGLFS